MNALLMTDLLLYLVQFAAMSAVVLFIELKLKRSILSDGQTIWAITWAVAQVGLLVLARLYISPLEIKGIPQDGALYCWSLVFWSFISAFLPVAFWSWKMNKDQVQKLLGRRNVTP